MPEGRMIGLQSVSIATANEGIADNAWNSEMV